MGQYSPDIFDAVDGSHEHLDEFICSICQYVMSYPTGCQGDDHLFCRECAKGLSACPLCAGPMERSAFEHPISKPHRAL